MKATSVDSKSKLKRPSIKVLRELLAADFETGDLIWRHRPRKFFPSDQSYKIWNTRYAGRVAGSTGNRGYKTVRLFDWPQLQHRVIWALYYGRWPTKEVDHINRVRTDNRIANLRQVSKRDQHKNMKRNRLNTSGVAGVDWVKKSQKWRARVGQKWIGEFHTIEEAEVAVISARRARGYDPTHGEPR